MTLKKHKNFNENLTFVLYSHLHIKYLSKKKTHQNIHNTIHKKLKRIPARIYICVCVCVCEENNWVIDLNIWEIMRVYIVSSIDKVYCENVWREQFQLIKSLHNKK